MNLKTKVQNSLVPISSEEQRRKRNRYSSLFLISIVGVLTVAAATESASAVPLETTSTTRAVIVISKGSLVDPDLFKPVTIDPAFTVATSATTTGPPTTVTTVTTMTTVRTTVATTPRSTTVPATTVKANTKPMAQSGSLIVTKNKPTKMVLVGVDPDAQTLSFAIVGQPAHGRIVGTAPNFMYQPAKNFTGIDAVTFVVSDGQMQSDAGVMTITVTGSTKSAKPAKPGKTTKTKKCTNGKKVCK
jgi:hypothetical protein